MNVSKIALLASVPVVIGMSAALLYAPSQVANAQGAFGNASGSKFGSASASSRSSGSGSRPISGSAFQPGGFQQGASQPGSGSVARQTSSQVPIPGIPPNTRASGSAVGLQGGSSIVPPPLRASEASVIGSISRVPPASSGIYGVKKLDSSSNSASSGFGSGFKPRVIGSAS